MTVPSTTSRDAQSGNGITVAFTVPFRILDQAHIQVLLTVAGVTTMQVLTTNYSVSGVGNPNTTVTFVVAPPNLSTITFLRSVPATQETDYVPNDPFPAESHERALDKLTMLVQQALEVIARSLTLPAQVSGVSTELPVPVASNIIGWDSVAAALRNYTLAELATIVAYANKRYQILAGTGAQTVFTLDADPGSLGNLEISIDGVIQVPVNDFSYVGTTLTFVVAPANLAVILVRYDEALPTGVTTASAVNFIAAGVGAVTGNVEQQLRYFVRPEQYGAIGDGVADDTAAIAAALTAADHNVLLTKKYRITNRIEIPNGKRLLGCGWAFQNYLAEAVADISGAAIVVDFGTGVAAEAIRLGRDSDIRDVAMLWPGQPAAGPGWVPTVTPWAIACGTFAESAQSVRKVRGAIENVALIGFSHGVKIERGMEAGRIHRLYGQPFTVGISLDGIHDVIEVSDVHFWPFQRVDTDTLDYQRANFIGITMGRVDGPILRDIFIYAAEDSVLFRGSTSPDFTNQPAFHVDGSNWYFDSCTNGVRADTTITAGQLSGKVVGMIYSRSSAAPANGHAVLIEARTKPFRFSHCSFGGAGFTKPGGYVSVSGANCIVSVDEVAIEDWDSAAAGTPAFEVSSTTSVLRVTDVVPLNSALNWNTGTKVLLRGDTTQGERNLLTSSFEEYWLLDTGTTEVFTCDSTDKTMTQRIYARPMGHGAQQYRIVGRLAGHATPTTFTIKAQGALTSITKTFVSGGGGGNEDFDSGWLPVATALGPQAFTDPQSILFNGTPGMASLSFLAASLLFR